MAIMSQSTAAQVPAAFRRLEEIARNLWFSWNDNAQELFRRLSPELWDRCRHNPLHMLQSLDSRSWTLLESDTEYAQLYREVIAQWDYYQNRETWFGETYPEYRHKGIAYFSAEFGFHESLPMYSGGLGILAGDHCKSASDMGVPLIGIGLMYRQGYFTQKLDADGNQQAERIRYEFDSLPVEPVLDEAGRRLSVTVPFPGRLVRLQAWKAQVGVVPVYFLDADCDGNTHQDRELTAQLYGGNSDTRIAQELLLGAGGIRLLRALKHNIFAYHINEGHAAFINLERLRELIAGGIPYKAALEAVRSSTVFTTHTPVPAGHDMFAQDLVRYYGQAFRSEMGEHFDAFLTLGVDRGTGAFNMTHLALNCAGLRNGVSRLHGQVSRDMFAAFYGAVPVSEIPIGHVTNGVHLQTWLAPELKELYDRFLPGTWRTNQTNTHQWQGMDIMPEESFWKVHQKLKERLLAFARRNIQEQLTRSGEPPERIRRVDDYFRADVLTIVFARRFATYKRANMIFNNLDALKKLVNDPDRPVQFLFAGKAHPADHPGQQLIREIHTISRMPEFEGKIAMLENYDMHMARLLVQGADVWLNNPKRRYEASGTSGQKAAANGVLHFSILDGWWEEGFNGRNGWAITAASGTDPDALDRENTESLYRVLTQEIIPLYYTGQPVPAGWIRTAKHSVKSIAPVFNTDRMVMDYTRDYYIPTIDRGGHFHADNLETARRVADFKDFLAGNWHRVAILRVMDPLAPAPMSTSADDDLTGSKEVQADIALGPVWHRDVAVEIVYYEEKDGDWEPVYVPMRLEQSLQDGDHRYAADIPGHLEHGSHYSVRVRPVSVDFAHAHELNLITSTLNRTFAN